MSDEAIRRRTGRGWQEWFDLLDDWGADARAHKEIACWLVDDPGGRRLGRAGGHGRLVLSVVDPQRMGIGSFQPNANHLALQVEDVAAARARLERRGVTFAGDIFDTGVCHMTFFSDPDGNALMLHHATRPGSPRSERRLNARAACDYGDLST